MIVPTKATLRRTTRTDQIILLEQSYTGKLNTPKDYNCAFANALRGLADKIEKVKNAWVDPEVVVWMHRPGRITAEITLSPPIKHKRK